MMINKAFCSLVDMVVKQLIKILCINAHKTDASPKDIKISSTPKAEVTKIHHKIGQDLDG